MSVAPRSDAAGRAWLSRLPKAELHLHLEGSIPPALAMALARRHGVAEALPAVVRQAALTGGAYRFARFSDFVEIFLAVSGLLRRAEDYAAAVEQLGRDLAVQGVRWAEVTFTPVTHLDRGIPESVFIDGLEAGRAAVRAAGGPELRWVFDIVRHLPDQAERTLELALRHGHARTGRGVVGLGLGGPEARSAPYARFAPVFARARAEGLAALPHAGEHAGAASVAAAVRELGARRIGHGVRSVEDPAVLELLVERGVALEVCLRSNLALGVTPSLAEHPLPRLRDAGVELSLATDDPPLFDAVLLDEYLDAAAAFGWGALELAELSRASLRHALMEPDARDALLDEHDRIVSAGLPAAG